LLRTEVSMYIYWYTRNRMHNPIINIFIHLSWSILLSSKSLFLCLCQPWIVVRFERYHVECRLVVIIVSECTLLCNALFNFFFVGCILLRYLYVYFPNIPAIATDNRYFFILFCLFTICFGPYEPSSGETQHHHFIFMKTIILQHIRYFYNYSPLWCTSLIINLPIYNHIMVIVLVKWIQYI
jgi:hypothetical protein